MQLDLDLNHLKKDIEDGNDPVTSISAMVHRLVTNAIEEIPEDGYAEIKITMEHKNSS